MKAPQLFRAGHWQSFEDVQNESVKERVLSVLQVVKLSKTQSPTTAEDRERMKAIPYASSIGSIKYAMRCTLQKKTHP